MPLRTPYDQADAIQGNGKKGGCDCQKGNGKKAIPKLSKKSVYDMFGDSRGAAPFEEDLLPAPNSNNRGIVGF